MEDYQWGGGNGENRREVSWIKKHKWSVQNRQGEVKNSIGNGEAKEVSRMTHRHDLRRGMQVGGEV